MVDELGWSRASVTGSIAFGSVCGGLVSLIVGPILDRYGPRMVSFFGILLLSLGLGAMMFVTHIWQLYLFFGVGRMIAVGVLSLATGPGPPLDPPWTRTQAARTRAFRVLTLINSLIPFIQGGINFHVYPFLTDQGMNQTTPVLVTTTIAAFGILTERFSVRKLLAASVLGNGLIFLALYWVVIFRIGGALGTGTIFILAALSGIFIRRQESDASRTMEGFFRPPLSRKHIQHGKPVLFHRQRDWTDLCRDLLRPIW